jgi:hypothetical protein
MQTTKSHWCLVESELTNARRISSDPEVSRTADLTISGKAVTVKDLSFCPGRRRV